MTAGCCETSADNAFYCNVQRRTSNELQYHLFIICWYKRIIQSHEPFLSCDYTCIIIACSSPSSSFVFRYLYLLLSTPSIRPTRHLSNSEDLTASCLRYGADDIASFLTGCLGINCLCSPRRFRRKTIFNGQ